MVNCHVLIRSPRNVGAGVKIKKKNKVCFVCYTWQQLLLLTSILNGISKFLKLSNFICETNCPIKLSDKLGNVQM